MVVSTLDMWAMPVSYHPSTKQAAAGKPHCPSTGPNIDRVQPHARLLSYLLQLTRVERVRLRFESAAVC